MEEPKTSSPNPKWTDCTRAGSPSSRPRASASLLEEGPRRIEIPLLTPVVEVPHLTWPVTSPKKVHTFWATTKIKGEPPKKKVISVSTGWVSYIETRVQKALLGYVPQGSPHPHCGWCSRGFILHQPQNGAPPKTTT